MKKSELIPKRFIRVWIGGEENIPEQFNKWWEEFQFIHPDYEFITITENSDLLISTDIKKLLNKVSTKAGFSDILRLVALHQLGGIYIDTDVMPLKSFDPLIMDRPFLGKRSGKSFETAIIGSPKNHTAILDVIKALPDWFEKNANKSASVQTGPGFVSSVLFGREDVEHFPINYFYPYNGFMAPKRNEKEIIFKDRLNFPEEMYAAHFSNHQWGGNPNKK